MEWASCDGACKGPAYGRSPVISSERSVRPAKAFPPVTLQIEQELLGIETAGKARQIAVCADDTVAGRHDRDRILAAGGAHGTRGRRTSDLLGDLSVGSGLSERNLQKRLPYAGLEFGADEVERHREHLQRAIEVRFQLPFGFDEDVVVWILLLRHQSYALRIVPLPQDCSQAALACDQGQLANGAARLLRVIRHSLSP